MSHEPIPGEVSTLPGTVFLTCPACRTTWTWMRPTRLTRLLACTCGRRWQVVAHDPSFTKIDWRPKA